jgi:hypothetical protein
LEERLKIVEFGSGYSLAAGHYFYGFTGRAGLSVEQAAKRVRAKVLVIVSPADLIVNP